MWLNAQKVEQITKPITNTTRGVGEGRAIRHATIRRPTNHTSPPSFHPPGPLAAAGLLGGRAVNAPQASARYPPVSGLANPPGPIHTLVGLVLWSHNALGHGPWRFPAMASSQGDVRPSS